RVPSAATLPPAGDAQARPRTFPGAGPAPRGRPGRAQLVVGADPGAGAGRASTPASLRCCAVIGAGAAVSGSKPPPVFGNAMTSRIESTPAISAVIRSQP